MLETKFVKLYPDDYGREEGLINDYACFGWVLSGREVLTKVVDGQSREEGHNLTFQRDANIPNRDKLESLFLRYTVKENEIKKAADAAKIPKKTYVVWFIIITVIAMAILIPAMLLPTLEFMWNPSVGDTILMIFLTVLFAGCAGVLLGIIPIGITSGIRQKKAANQVKDRVYGEMAVIAREAAQFLQ